MLDELINGRAGFDHEHHPARFLEQAGHFLQRMRSYNIRAFRLLRQKIVHLRDRAIESHDGEAVIVHV